MDRYEKRGILVGFVPKNKREFAIEYVSRAKAREIAGLAKYGDFDPRSDKRILSAEAQEEDLDIFNYMRFYERKYGRSLETTEIKQLSFKLYQLLKKLEEVETLKRGGVP